MTSTKITKKTKIGTAFFLILIFYIFFSASVLALDPLVPCGRTGQPACTTCDLLVLGKNISDFILFYLVPALAALFFIYAGFLILLGGGIPAQVGKGQSVFKTTAYGLMIIFLAWLIVNTTLRTIAGDQNIAQDWWKLECKETIRKEPPPTTTTISEETTTTVSGSTTTVRGGTTTTVRGSTTTTISLGGTTTTLPAGSTTTVRPGSTTTTTRGSSTTTTIAGSTTTTTSAPLACVFNGVNYSTLNLCSGQRRPGGCGTSSCSQYLASINRYAGGAASAAVLKTFMVIESDCNIRAGTSSSYGLMQIRPETANMFKSGCGVTENITSSWLTSPANADKSICIGAAFIRSLAAGACGPEPRNMYAGYNAGPGNCASSSDCASDRSCSGGAVKRWECPYDNPQHTVCNTGMYETKQGATYINYCINNLGF